MRALVTDGGRTAAGACRLRPIDSGCPPQVLVTRVTHAGDTFMAAHIAAELRARPREAALHAALLAAYTCVSEDIN